MTEESSPPAPEERPPEPRGFVGYPPPGSAGFVGSAAAAAPDDTGTPAQPRPDDREGHVSALIRRLRGRLSRNAS